MTLVAVTGGSGKLGRAVVRELLAHGYDVVNLDLAAPREQLCPYTRIDFTDYGQAVEAFTAIDSRYRKVDAVVHLAAIPGPGVTGNAATFANNVTVSYNVFAAARAAGIRNVVWASSETLLGLPFDTPPPYLPVDEEYETRPETAYALAKRLDEEMAAQFCRWEPELKMIGLRFSNVMEPGDYAAFPSYQDDPTLRSWNLWSYIDCRDGAQAARLALEYQVPGLEVFIIANADSVMHRPSAELAGELFPQVPWKRPVESTQTLLSIDKARRLLGYEPRYGWR
ncbi:NAD-dependent epimerase/dehydratase family protein [Catellatospora tritici]|uniref:NAD-dependent epimerase/dehydratase family protein n=1 Tax=Catellatospora tritici TaxID=2851566 RepID=UPI001C2D598B|nr:NAD(P)-dependent oxidoreductase [Catellatospora tritici]MBV1849531.1 NAD(P)-dependent oxidoreductase [Catellatospora tritici]MBV1854103.1 NAD(P)-dependent oxidoreductase [Catellatospora tritici]